MTYPEELTNQKSENRHQRSEAGDQKSELYAYVEKVYLQGIAAHGDLGIALEDFAVHLNSIIDKHLGERLEHNAAEDGALSQAAMDFAVRLNLEDLYLACACAYNSPASWSRLAELYSKHIDNIAHSICPAHQEARDVAENVLGHLFFHDHSGRSRIASYEGRCSLRKWLTTIIKHQSLNQRHAKSAEALPLDSLRNTASSTLDELEAALLRSKYHEAIIDSFEAAAKELTERERLVLVLRFEEEMEAREIAKMLDVHPSQITRTIKHAEIRIRTAVLTRLGVHHGLSSEAIKECLDLILASSEASIAGFLTPIIPPATTPEPRRLLKMAASAA